MKSTLPLPASGAATPVYRVHRALLVDLDLAAEWNHPAWRQAETLDIRHFRPEGSDHRPRVCARLLHGEQGIRGIFRVRDRYVHCLRTKYHSSVWKDSCVEFFAQPKAGHGYFNFEFNCGGAFLCNYIVDPTRTRLGFKQFSKVPARLGRAIQVRASLPRRVDPEIVEETDWTLSFFIPFALMERYVGRLGPVAGQAWRGNFYKCADDNSHPHWGSWSPVEEFNFHLPRCFGVIRFL